MWKLTKGLAAISESILGPAVGGWPEAAMRDTVGQWPSRYSIGQTVPRAVFKSGTSTRLSRSISSDPLRLHCWKTMAIIEDAAPAQEETSRGNADAGQEPTGDLPTPHEWVASIELV